MKLILYFISYLLISSPNVRPVDEDLGFLCAVKCLYSRHVHRMLQVLVGRTGHEHEVTLTGADVFEAGKDGVWTGKFGGQVWTRQSTGIAAAGPYV